MNFGTSTDEKNSFEVLDAFVEGGGNFIDTSNNYAHWLGTGDESETTLGKWLRLRGNRDKLIIATKVGFDRHGKGQGLKKEQIEYWIDESLRKLNTDYVDVYYAHTDDPTTPLEETMEAFDSLVKKGKVRVIAASNYDVWRFMDANLVAKKRGFVSFQAMQQRFLICSLRLRVRLNISITSSLRAKDYVFFATVNCRLSRIRVLRAADMRINLVLPPITFWVAVTIL